MTCQDPMSNDSFIHLVLAFDFNVITTSQNPMVAFSKNGDQLWLRRPSLWFSCVCASLALFASAFNLSRSPTFLEQASVGRPVLPQDLVTQETMLSPVCKPHFGTSSRSIRRIVLFHTRKAGGTTLFHYLKKVAKHYNIAFEHIEATPIEMPGNRSDTLCVTHLRHPVSRVISGFKYEGRWPCQQVITNQSYVPTAENAVDFDTWIEATPCKVRMLNDVPTLWECSTNCYIQWLNYDQFRKPTCRLEDVSATPESYSRALSAALKFHIIIDVERLFQMQGYGTSIERVFGVPGLVGSQSWMYCGKASRRANQQVPLVVKNSTIKDLRQRNQADLSLFQNLTTCHGPIQFPTSTLAEFVADESG